MEHLLFSSVVVLASRPGRSFTVSTFSASFTELEVTKKIKRLIKNRDQPPLHHSLLHRPYFFCSLSQVNKKKYGRNWRKKEERRKGL